jgi:hypothetical protein
MIPLRPEPGSKKLVSKKWKPEKLEAKQVV